MTRVLFAMALIGAAQHLSATGHGFRDAEVVIKDISVLDPAASSWMRHRDLVIKGTTIASVLPTGGPLPSAKVTINGSGKFAVPGFFDNHVHLARFTPDTAALFIASGITSVRDMGTDPERILSWRRDIARGTFMGPRIVQACGPMLEGAGEPRVDHWLVRNAEEATAIVNTLADRGFGCVKVRTFKDAATYRAIAAAARSRGLMLTGHAPEPLSILEALAEGQRTFEHAFYPYPLTGLSEKERATIARALVSSRAALVPTLVAWQPATRPLADLERELHAFETSSEFRLPDELSLHWRGYLSAHERQGHGSEGWRQAVASAATDIGTLHRAGVLVLPGTDTGAPFVTPGIALHHELALLVSDAGFSAAAALRSATIDSTAFHGRAADLGSLETGKIADIVILTADPLSDIKHTRDIDTVVFRGETLTPAHLNALRAKTVGRAAK